MNQRKIIILAVSFLACLAIFIVISVITDTPDLSEPDKNKVSYKGLREPNDLGQMIGKIGDLQPGQIAMARYKVKDEKTGKVSRILGFERLLRQVGEDWELEKPYYKMIEKNFTCELTADTGTVQIEMVGSNPIPKDAQLQGNVVIVITPTGKSSVKKSKVFLDDVVFNHTNSQFSTEGPIRFTSLQGELVGTGMQLIYNSLMQRLELFRIIDVEFIHIKDFKSSASVIKTVDNKPVSTTADLSEAADNKDDAPTKYKCVFKDNVVVKYDNQMIYASQVDISNLFFSNDKDENKESVSTSIENKDAAFEELTDDTFSSTTEIFVTCKGGVTIRPMEYFEGKANNSRILELSGEPVEIKKQYQNSDALKTFARCGLLKYDIDRDILDMQALKGGYPVSINLDEKGSKLDTTGSVQWRKNDNLAVVNGPGSVCVSQEESAKMDFKGMMKLYFENNSPLIYESDSPKLERIDFLGPITASANKSKLDADSASLLFDKNNAITTADLDGNVQVKNDSGELSSERAKVVFAKDEKQKIEYIDLLEKVAGATEGRDDFKADFGRLYFDQTEKLTQAKLKGNVILVSDKMQLFTEKVDIEFETDPNGKTYASKAQSYGQATIKTDNSDSITKTSSFWAEKIDYDFASGSAVADGPVKFVFYTLNGQSPVPVTITAKRNAQFILKQNKVVLNGDVVGSMTEDKQGFSEVNNFYGDKLVIDLVSNDLNTSDENKQTRVKNISLTGRKVRLLSVRRNGIETISAIKLVCKRMDFDAIENTITATGSPSTSQIQINNENLPQPKKKTSVVSFKRPSYALIQFFDTLKWSLDNQIIEADGKDNRLYLGYIPVLEDGSDGPKVEVTSGYAKAIFHETTPGKAEISTVSASNGISYEDKKYQFEGANLFYETGSSFVRITGDKGMNCLFNGAKADSIEYNLKTGKATAEIGQAPGILPF